MRKYWLVVQVSADIGGQFQRRGIAACPVLFQGPQGDGVKVSPQQTNQGMQVRVSILCGRSRIVSMGAEPGARARRILFAEAQQNLIVGQFSKIEWQRPAEQLVEHYAKRIDVASGIDVLPARVGLLGADVAKSANQRPDLGVQRTGIQALCGRFGYAKIDDVGDRLTVHFGDQDVRGLQIAMDDGLLVSMLDPLAYRH
jgi:hypothetical protein